MGSLKKHARNIPRPARAYQAGSQAARTAKLRRPTPCESHLLVRYGGKVGGSSNGRTGDDRQNNLQIQVHPFSKPTRTKPKRAGNERAYWKTFRLAPPPARSRNPLRFSSRLDGRPGPAIMHPCKSLRRARCAAWPCHRSLWYGLEGGSHPSVHEYFDSAHRNLGCRGARTFS